ncbi:MAG: CPXCG motif-containing cysteine-rich protein [Pirellulaceae bacterium]|jgi:hypothetical protein|nr:CPXCG motif-containing cysteine-rich protein [Pirellulaceae bacterium]
MNNESSYLCENCGEEIVVPIDFSAGSHQSYVEDCPVCCSPSLIRVIVDEQGEVQVNAQAEQDRF